MPHALLIAAIFTAYFGSMAGLMAYLASQVRHREDEPREDLADLDVRDGEPGPMLIAA